MLESKQDPNLHQHKKQTNPEQVPAIQLSTAPIRIVGKQFLGLSKSSEEGGSEGHLSNHGRRHSLVQAANPFPLERLLETVYHTRVNRFGARLGLKTNFDGVCKKARIHHM